MSTRDKLKWRVKLIRRIIELQDNGMTLDQAMIRAKFEQHPPEEEK